MNKNEMNIGCSVIIYDSEGKILIAQRCKNKELFPLMWENIGGHLEPNETPEECIKRETKEEIGCELLDLKLFTVTVKTVENRQFVLIAFTGRISGAINLQYDEIEQVRWISKEELAKFDFCFNCRKEIDEFLEKVIIEEAHLK
jgi:8-oxo-dGTP diphosphatase